MYISATELLSRIAHKIYEWQWGAFNNEITIGEEAMTEFLMLELCKHKSQVAIEQFTKKRESENGADFDLVIFSAYGYAHFAVQAKRLYKIGGYNHLRASKYTDQHRVLGEYAAKNGAVPIYCLYNVAEESCVKTTWRYKKDAEYFSGNGCIVEDFGCTVCPFDVISEFISGGFINSFGGINGAEQVCLLKDLPQLATDLYTNQENTAYLSPNYSDGKNGTLHRFGRSGIRNDHSAMLTGRVDARDHFHESLAPSESPEATAVELGTYEIGLSDIVQRLRNIYRNENQYPRFSIAIYDENLCL